MGKFHEEERRARAKDASQLMCEEGEVNVRQSSLFHTGVEQQRERNEERTANERKKKVPRKKRVTRERERESSNPERERE